MDFIRNIPDVVWAAIGASLLTLSGVILSNCISLYQQLKQLKHDANQRDREREMSLRREIYLPAAEAFHKSHNLLMRLADLNIPDKQLDDEFVKDVGVIGKIQVVGTNATVQAVYAFYGALGTAYAELFLKRFLLIKRKNQIELLQDSIDKSFKEQERYNALMNQMNLAGAIDKKTWDVINNAIEFERKQYDQFNTEQELLYKEQTKEHSIFLELVSQRYFEVSKLIPPAIFALRDEIELEIDRIEYMKTFNENIEKGKTVIKSFLKDIRVLTEVEP